MKRCSRCRTELPLQEFYRDRRSRDGRQGCCRECQTASSRRWQQEHPERAREIWRRASARRRLGLHQPHDAPCPHGHLLSQGGPCQGCQEASNATRRRSYRRDRARRLEVFKRDYPKRRARLEADPQKLAAYRAQRREYMQRYRVKRAQVNSDVSPADQLHVGGDVERGSSGGGPTGGEILGSGAGW